MYLTEMPNFNFYRISNNNNKPIISVICINKNHDKYIEDNFLSVLSQKFDDFEFIVADGGSTDKSLEIIKNYKFIKLLPGVDSSRSEGIIRAIHSAKGKYIMITTSTDGYMSRNWFEVVSKILNEDKKISLVYGASVIMSTDGSLGNIVFPKPKKFDKGNLTKKWQLNWLINGLSKSYLPELNYCVRKEVITQLIGKSVDYPELNEIDPILRFHFEFNRHGYISKYVPIIANFGRSHENSEQVTARYADYINIYNNALHKYQNLILLNKIKLSTVNAKGLATDYSLNLFEYIELAFNILFIKHLRKLYIKLKREISKILI